MNKKYNIYKYKLYACLKHLKYIKLNESIYHR